MEVIVADGHFARRLRAESSRLDNLGCLTCENLSICEQVFVNSLRVIL
jgi:hypothetical protein